MTRFSVYKKKGPSRRRILNKKPVAKKPVDKRQDKQLIKLFRLIKFSKEQKYVDSQLQTTAGTTWNNLLTRPLTYIPEGTTVNTRIGNKISISNINFKCIVTVGDATNLYRILIVKFGHCPTASIAIANVLENPTNVTPFQIMSFLKRNSPSKFKILWDSGVQSLVGDGAAGATRTIHSQKSHHVKLRFPNGELVQYANANANSEVNGLTYVVAVSDSALAPNVGFQSMARVIFQG